MFYYCHFPDRYLARPSRNPLKRIYRYVLDSLESVSLRCADYIAVNSKFTLGKVRQAFPKLSSRITENSVMYPPVSTSSADAALQSNTGKSLLEIGKDLPDDLRNLLDPARKSEGAPGNDAFVLLSINRFETKKNILLAVRAFAACGRLAPMFQRKGILVLAGGYDENNPDNVSCMNELKEEVRKHGLSDRVVFIPSFSSDQKSQLLSIADILLYTPSGEHFGIVPFVVFIVTFFYFFFSFFHLTF